MVEETAYDATQIQVIEGLQAIRKRPAMYIGSVDARGLHHLVHEVVDNSIDEAMAGFCKEIQVTLNADGSVTVADDGRGIPVDIHPKYGAPGVEIVLSRMHSGGKFERKMYRVSGGLHGVGLSVVNGLSEWLEVRVKREGQEHRMRFERGKKASDLEVVGPAEGTGTIITFLPDSQVFESIEFDYDILATRLRELAFLNAGLRIIIVDKVHDRGDVFQFQGGIAEYVKWINRAKNPLHPDPIQFAKESDGTLVEVAMQYHDGYNESIFTFVNNIDTIEGGTHLVGFKAGLESDEMGPAFDRVDIVDEREDRFVVAIVILHRDFDEGSVGLLRELDRIRMERILRAVDPLDILGDASLELEHIPAVVDLIHNDDPKAGVQECQLPQACRQDVVVEFDGFEDLRIRKESDDRPGAFRRSDDLEVRGLLAAREPHPVFLAVPLHADLEPFAQTIDDGETDAVQPAGHAVHLPFELPAAVHPRQDDLDSRRAVLRVDVDRDPATVICHRDGSVRVQGDLDLLAEAGHRLVDRVVDDLVDQVVEAARVDRADVHRRPLSDRLQAFEDLNLRGVVGGLFYHLFRNLSERVSVPSSSPSRGTVQVYGRLL